MIHFFNEQTTYKIQQKKKIKAWLTYSIKQEGFNCGNINIILCSDEYLLKINQDYLKHDTYTDIITFDYSEKNTLSGDLFISIQRVKENAAGFSVKVYDELLRVMVHGVLHLCGYKDKKENEEKIMRKKENEKLSIFFINNNL